jgi:hypothetical protein
MTVRTRVDDAGIRLVDPPDGPVDVRFGGHRLWSFNPTREGAPSGDEGVLVEWPRAIKERLAGTAHVSVVPHETDQVWFDEEVSFASSTEPLHFVDDAGNPVTLDKGGRLQRTFDRMDPASLTELTTASRRVLDDLADKCGVDAYLCYGGLLGAVRTGKMIGHDSDVDLAWISAHTHPFDVIRESRRIEREMRELGWKVVRMSAANFKVWAPLPNGKRAGVDVFGSFHVGENFHLSGSLRGPLPRESILPFGTVELEGVEFPAPRDLDAFLTYTYGPGWRVPDPAFHFDHPPENKQVMSQWLRGSRTRLWYWQEFYQSARARDVPTTQSRFAEWVAGRIDAGSRVVELGSGTGRDAVWLARQGFEVLATDYCGNARRRTTAAAREAGVKVQVRALNLEAPYSYLSKGAELAHEPGVRHVYARFLIDALAPGGRDGLWRYCSMVCRSGGRTFLEFRTRASREEPKFFGPHIRTYARVGVIEDEIAAHGGRIVEKVVGRNLAPLGHEDPEVCRMEVSWR